MGYRVVFLWLFVHENTHSNNKARAFPAFEVGDLISLCFAIKSVSGALFIRRAARHFLHVTQTMDLYSSRIRPERLKNYQEHRNLKDFGAGLEESGRFSEIPASLVAQQISNWASRCRKNTCLSRRSRIIIKGGPILSHLNLPAFFAKKDSINFNADARKLYCYKPAAAYALSSAFYPFVGAQSHTQLSVYI
jgi:hypothetical protein